MHTSHYCLPCSEANNVLAGKIRARNRAVYLYFPRVLETDIKDTNCLCTFTKRPTHLSLSSSSQLSFVTLSSDPNTQKQSTPTADNNKKTFPFLYKHLYTLLEDPTQRCRQQHQPLPAVRSARSTTRTPNPNPFSKSLNSNKSCKPVPTSKALVIV